MWEWQEEEPGVGVARGGASGVRVARGGASDLGVKRIRSRVAQTSLGRYTCFNEGNIKSLNQQFKQHTVLPA